MAGSLNINTNHRTDGYRLGGKIEYASITYKLLEMEWWYASGPVEMMTVDEIAQRLFEIERELK